MSYDKYLEHIDTTMGGDTPIAFGLHPNAEIDFRTQQSDTMFKVPDATSGNPFARAQNRQAAILKAMLPRSVRDVALL